MKPMSTETFVAPLDPSDSDATSHRYNFKLKLNASINAPRATLLADYHADEFDGFPWNRSIDFTYIVYETYQDCADVSGSCGPPQPSAGNIIYGCTWPDRRRLTGGSSPLITRYIGDETPFDIEAELVGANTLTFEDCVLSSEQSTYTEGPIVHLIGLSRDNQGNEASYNPGQHLLMNMPWSTKSFRINGVTFYPSFFSTAPDPYAAPF